MFDHSDFMELIIIAAISAVLIYKFFTTLGERRGFESTPQPDTIFGRSVSDHDQSIDEQTARDEKEALADHLKQPFDTIQSIDKRFSIKSFSEGATMAFEMVLKAYASSDLETLKILLSDKMFHEFESAIQDRDNKHHKMSTTLVKLQPLEIQDITITNSMAEIQIKFVSEQTNILYDANQNIIDGNPNQIEEVTDVWTFQRDLHSSNPNWFLVETHM